MDGVIGALRVEAGKPGRVRVVLREGGSFTLASALAAGLRLGQALPAVEVERLQQLDRQEQGVQYSLRLLARRPRSEHELRQALGRRGLDGADEQAVIERLQQGGWLGDLAFAQAWVENRRDFRPRSARALRYELKQKGVASPAIEAALQGFDEAGAAEAAARAGARKYAALPEEVFRPRLAGYLSRRGFDYSTIAPLVTQMWSERATQESEVSR
jgi:regulatory protein